VNPSNGRGGRGNAGDFDGFKNYGQMVAARHVSENLGIDYDALKGLMTGDNPKSLGRRFRSCGLMPMRMRKRRRRKSKPKLTEEPSLCALGSFVSGSSV
jgi:hypothetical protein